MVRKRNTHGASKKDAGIQRKVGLGLCLAKFSKQGDLHADVLTEADGTHVEVARGVATEHMLERKSLRSQCVKLIHKENGLV